jgi:hypothetical protein
LAKARYISQAGMWGETFDFKFTALGRTRCRELFVRLRGVPKIGSRGRRSAILKLAPELKHPASDGTLEWFVLICEERGNNPDAPFLIG